MKIFVKTLKGTHFEIEVKPEDSVCEFLQIVSLLVN
jgi:UV excision repair protein RAD23